MTQEPRSPQVPRFAWVNAINVIAIVCLISVVARQILLDVPEPVPGFARAGDVWNNLALAYIGAWFFNLLVIEMPKKAARQRVMAAYKDELREVSTRGSLFLEALATKKGRLIAADPSLDDVTALCKSVKRSSRSPYYTFRGQLTSETLDWIEYFDDHLDAVDRAHSRLRPAHPFLKPETIALMQSVRNTEFELFIRQSRKIGLVSDTLEPLADSLYHYVVNCRRLEAHLQLPVYENEDR